MTPWMEILGKVGVILIQGVSNFLCQWHLCTSKHVHGLPCSLVGKALYVPLSSPFLKVSQDPGEAQVSQDFKSYGSSSLGMFRLFDPDHAERRTTVTEASMAVVLLPALPSFTYLFQRVHKRSFFKCWEKGHHDANLWHDGPFRFFFRMPLKQVHERRSRKGWEKGRRTKDSVVALPSGL